MLNNNSKISNLITSLDADAWQKLGIYLLNYSKNKRIHQLYTFLNNNTTDNKINKTDIYKAVFNNKLYNDNSYRQLIYQFKKVYDQFILSSIPKATVEDQVRLAKYYKKKNLDYNENKRKLDKIYLSTSSIQEYKAIYYLETEKMDEILQFNDRTKEPNLQVLNDVLDKLYLIEKFKIVCSAINYANINQYQYDFGLINHLEAQIKQIITELDGLLYGMYKTFQLMKYKDEKYFIELHRWINQTEIEHTEEFELIFLMMNNYCIRQINLGNTDYFKQLFSLNQLMIVNGLILDEYGHISPHAAKNIIAVSLRLKENTWTKKFIENCSTTLKEDIRDETLSYLWARYEYENKFYEKALKHLAITLPIDLLNNSSFRVLQLKCLFELDEFEMMETALENFRLYLIRHKNQTNYFYSNANFIKYLKQIIKHNKNATKHKLFEKLQVEKLVAEKLG